MDKNDAAAVTVVITTRNRRDELRVALASCITQDYPHTDIRVYDDCSDDGTAEMVKREFPAVTLRRSIARQGLIALRNRGYWETRSKYVLSMDDDAWLTDRSTIRALVQQLESDARLGALAIPFLEPAPVGREKSSSAIEPGAELKTFVGTAHVCRVAAVRQVGGYRTLLVHQGEERDLCIRLRAAGWSIRMGDAPALVHAVSPNRDVHRIHRYGVRNQLLYDFFYAPWFILPLVATRHAVSLLTYRRSASWAVNTLVYLAGAAHDCWRYRKHRSSYSASTYWSHMQLPSHQPRFVDASALPPPCI